MTQATVATPPVTEDVPVIKIGNATFRLIFHDLYRPLTAGEFAGLKDSIERHGIRQDITVFSRGNLVFDVIDGAHRVRAASELGFHLHQVPYKHAAGTPEELRALAETLNEDRRQLTVEERRERALKLRQQGQSYRQIGEALKVDPATAMRDVKASGVATPTPATVTGKDGKAYPATAPEIPEREIEIVRDLVAEVLPSWTKPIEAGHITNAVRRRPGGAEVSVRAVRAALERMIEAGNVVKSRNAQNYTVYALTHDPAIDATEQPGESPAPEAGEPIAPLSMGGAEIADWLGKQAEKTPAKLTPEDIKRAILEALALGPRDLVAMRDAGQLVPSVSPAKFWDYITDLIQAGAITRDSEQPNTTYELVPDTAAQSDTWLDQQASKPAPAEQGQTQQSKDAARILDLLKQYPQGVPFDHVRKALALNEDRFTRARMLLWSEGAIARDERTLKLALKPEPAPEPHADETPTALDEDFARKLSDLINLAGMVAGHFERVLERPGSLPDWLPAKLNELQAVLHGGRPDDMGKAHPGLNGLLDASYERLFSAQGK